MTSARNDSGSRMRTTVTRVHAICLFVVTIAATTGSTLGWKGRGPLNVLASEPYGYVGLFQAYFLMFLLALVCLIGAMRWPSRLWNVALLVAWSRTWLRCRSSSSPTTCSFRPTLSAWPTPSRCSCTFP
jgi:hypothetical protein